MATDYGIHFRYSQCNLGRLGVRSVEREDPEVDGSAVHAGLTVFKLKKESLRLISFNTTPHLLAPEMRTFR